EADRTREEEPWSGIQTAAPHLSSTLPAREPAGPCIHGAARRRPRRRSRSMTRTTFSSCAYPCVRVRSSCGSRGLRSRRGTTTATTTSPDSTPTQLPAERGAGLEEVITMLSRKDFTATVLTALAVLAFFAT